MHIFEFEKEYNLSELNQTLKKLSVRFDWIITQQEDDFSGKAQKAENFDIDASVFLLNVLKMIRSEQDFVFYNNPKDADEAVTLISQDLTPDISGEKQRIDLNLGKIPYEIQTLIFAVSLHNGRDKRQDLSMIENISLSLFDADGDVCVGTYHISNFDKDSHGVLCLELNRLGPEWTIRPIKKCAENGLAEIAQSFDVNIRNA